MNAALANGLSGKSTAATPKTPNIATLTPFLVLIFHCSTPILGSFLFLFYNSFNQLIIPRGGGVIK